MLGNNESVIEAIERIREDMRIAEQRHIKLREEFANFKMKYYLNSTAMQNMRLAIAAQGGE